MESSTHEVIYILNVRLIVNDGLKTK